MMMMMMVILLMMKSLQVLVKEEEEMLRQDDLIEKAHSLKNDLETLMLSRRSKARELSGLSDEVWSVVRRYKHDFLTHIADPLRLLWFRNVTL